MMAMACTIPSIKPAISPIRAKPNSSVVRCSQAEGPLRRPSAPTPPSRPSISATPTPKSAATPPLVSSTVTLEYQRKMAKEMQEYFRQKKLEQADKGPFFGFLAKNEIANGRWAMFGFSVGLLTEYATGADFVQQLKILLSNFGIVDLD
ncbi:light-harvesting complex-like protein OHP2, chloroplastic [Wolffia australiana]